MGNISTYCSLQLNNRGLMMSELTLFNRNFLRDFFNDHSSPSFFIHPFHRNALKEDFKVDIKESKETYQIYAELPGIKKEDLHVTVDSGVLTISAETKQQNQETKDGKVIHSERYYGSVSRSFQLPTAIDQTTSEAKYENGMLQLVLHKKTSITSNRIEIK